ncbi:RidA family protein [Nonomuraea sp. NPDC049141]|uniref:RidA family protein n=1 Tax=Nonomuraea sp. NPDC049141 TaxID=3155500 RepID=UPI0033D610FC
MSAENVILTPIQPPDAPPAMGGYAQALTVTGVSRLVFVSGQIPESPDGHVPDDFETQCRTVWNNILACLTSAGLGASSLVKVTTFLSKREYADANSAIRREILGDHRPALTVIVSEIFDKRWLLEIEAIAAG